MISDEIYSRGRNGVGQSYLETWECRQNFDVSYLLRQKGAESQNCV